MPYKYFKIYEFKWIYMNLLGDYFFVCEMGETIFAQNEELRN
jgi:hypothetical protein